MESVTFFHLEASYLGAPVMVALMGALVALRLADRARSQRGSVRRVWLLCAGLALGAGIWGTHFATALALGSSAAFLGFALPPLLASLAAALLCSAAAFQLTPRSRNGFSATALSTALSAAGTLGSHHLALLALEMSPALQPGLGRLAASALLMLGLYLAAFLLFFQGRFFTRLNESRRQLIGAALIAGGLLLMELASLSGAFVLPRKTLQDGPATQELLWALTIGSLGVVLALLLIASLMDADLEARTRKLSASLRSARLKLSYATRHDLLTRLLNRPAFEEHLQRSLDSAGARRVRPAVLLLELDDFKSFNGAWGPSAGDHILQQAAARLKQMARPDDVVARIGWEQFAVLMEHVESPREMTRAARRLVRALSRPMKMPHGPAHLTCSIGIASQSASHSPQQLLAQAHAAMLDARFAGGGTFRFFEPPVTPDSPEMVTMEHELRLALERGEFELHYQPIVHAATLQPCAIEALIRWHHPVRGLLNPSFFLPAAERLDLTRAIGQWVLEEAAAQFVTWTRMGLDLRMSVNAFPSQVRTPGVAAQLAEVHRRFGITPGSLGLDIPEPVLDSETQAAQALFAALRQIGMPGSIDDFGHACNLQQLRTLRPREVKLDRGLVSKLESSAEAAAVMEAVIRLAHALEIRVVAKGVETQRQQDLLVALRCDELQGLHFAGAMPSTELTEYLQRGNGSPAGAAASPAKRSPTPAPVH